MTSIFFSIKLATQCRPLVGIYQRLKSMGPSLYMIIGLLSQTILTQSIMEEISYTAKHEHE
jgi:hypothetical protein